MMANKADINDIKHRPRVERIFVESIRVKFFANLARRKAEKKDGNLFWRPFRSDEFSGEFPALEATAEQELLIEFISDFHH